MEAQVQQLLRSAMSMVEPKLAARFEQLRTDASLSELGIDSVSTMELIGYVEEKIGRTFPDEQLGGLVTLDDFAELVRKQLPCPQ